MWLGKLTRSVCTQCLPCNPTGSDASWWCHRLEAQHQPRLQLAEPLERHPGGGREGIQILKCCNYTKLRSLIDVNEAFSGLLYLPQSSCSLLLVDVDEVSHHAALDHVSLSLHTDLQGQIKATYFHLHLRQWKHANLAQNAFSSTSWGLLIRPPLECQGEK